jgi:pullulanase
LALALAFASLLAQAQDTVANADVGARLDDCNAPTHARVTVGTPPGAPTEARALWLNATQLQWPGMQASHDTRWRLHHSARGIVQATVGQTVQGADGAVTLTPSQDALDTTTADKFKHLKEGVRLGLPSTATGEAVPTLQDLLRRSTVLTEEDAQGLVLAATLVQTPGALDAAYAAATTAPELGATVRATHTTWRLWAPTARRVLLCTYPNADAPSTALSTLQRDGATGVWQTQLPHGGAPSVQARGTAHTYTYLVEVFTPSAGWVVNRVTDPYALGLTRDSQRSVAVDLDAPALQPHGWHTMPVSQRVKTPTDMVVYELHLRDFSITDRSVPARDRGKYLGFTHPNSRGMQHLRKLSQAGVTDVHLLPVFDIASVPEQGCVSTLGEVGKTAPDSPTPQALVKAAAGRHCYNWGYDPLHFTAPEGSYASQPNDAGQRILEFRRMVMALRRAGLRVGMDVVYNHTSASGQHPQSVLDRIVPGYYHRLNDAGAVERSTCCDNTATEHTMMGKLMVDSLRVWATQYGIESFRFDLMGHQPRALMLQAQADLKRATGRDMPFIGEGWNFGEVANDARFVQATQTRLNGTGIATFNDRGRDAARGGGCCDDAEGLATRQGWLNGLHANPNDQAKGTREATRDKLLQANDLLRVSLAGSLRGVRFENHRGEQQSMDAVDYAGQPAAYAAQPGEVVNYVENHDNQTLFDVNAFKLPLATSREDRARVQVLGTALVLLAQGVPYLHAGQELLRSKSLDRNSFASGDRFNQLDWSLRSNHFGEGLPPESENGTTWPLMKPLLAARDRIAPTPPQIRDTRDATLALLRVRASSSLFRMTTADDVQKRLRFFNAGPSQEPTVLAFHLDGRGLKGANFKDVVVVMNADTRAHTVSSPAWVGQRLDPHPTWAALVDSMRHRAKFRSATGTWLVPQRSVAIWVAR